MINYLEEFERQWDSLESAMYAEITDLLKVSDLPVDRVNEVYQDECNRWRTPSQGNYSWLQMLNRTNPEIATKFESKLYTLRLTEEEYVAQNSQVSTVVTGCCGAVAGYLAASVISPWGIPTNLAVGLAAGALSGWCINKKEAGKTEAAHRDLTDRYMQQIASHGKILRSILAAMS